MAKQKLYGVLAQFETPADVYHGCEKVRDAGFTKWDAHTPFPVHGLDRAMGMKATPLPWIVLGMGITGFALGLGLQYWTMAVDYKYMISGKEYFSWPAFVPITFELTVLLSAFGAVFGMFGLNRLPTLYHDLFTVPRFARVTDDKFFISIEATDPKFDEKETAEFLKRAGASAVEIVQQH